MQDVAGRSATWGERWSASEVGRAESQLRANRGGVMLGPAASAMGGGMVGQIKGMYQRPTTGLAALAGLALCALCGCGEDPAPATPSQKDATAQADTSNRSHFYTATLNFHGGKHDGRVIALDRDLKGVPGVVSFGNTHLMPPAVALGLEDSIHVPAKDPNGKAISIAVSVQLRFGILVEAAGFVAHTPKAGSYPFSCTSPLVQVKLDTELYRSTCPGNGGEIKVDQWSATATGRFRGSFSGKVGRHKTDPAGTDDCAAGYAEQACSYAQPSWVEVSGQFDLVLPELNQD